MKRALWVLVLLAAAAAAKSLEITLIDVEGGKAMLLVGPTGQSLLVDAGWPVWRDRPSSTGRIVEAIQAAGLTRVDFLLMTHYDIDHIGDVPGLVARIPVGHIFDRGDFESPSRGAMELYAAYARVRAGIGHTVLKPGDHVPLGGVGLEVVSAAGRLTTRAGVPNPLCARFEQPAPLASDVEDDQSVGLLITYGAFRMLDLADLEAHLSHALACPVNRIGRVDVYNANVHGQFKGIAPALVGALGATVIIQTNGAAKGADAQTWPVLKSAQGLQDLWQLHFSLNAGKERNPPEEFIANLEPSDGYASLRISVSDDGTYRITNTRNGFNKTYRAQAAATTKRPLTRTPH